MLKRIEGILDTEFIPSPEPEYTGAGYTLGPGGQVTEVILHGFNNMDLKQIVPQLKRLKGLTRLNLSDNWLKDKDAALITELKNLEDLNVSLNALNSLAFVTAFKKLTKLDAGSNNCSNVTTLAQAKTLTELNLRNNQIADAAPLASLQNLVKLNLNSNGIGDLALFADLKYLAELELGHNEITDITPLAKLDNLSCLHLNANRVYNINPLARLKDLNSLDLSDNGLSDIEPISYYQRSLKILNLGYNRIVDIRPIAQLQNLEELNLKQNSVHDIYCLSNQQNLKKLNLGSMRVRSMNVIAKLKQLTELTLFETGSRDLIKLGGLSNLTKLDLNIHQVFTLESIKYLKNLRTLRIYGWGLDSLTSIVEFKKLSELSLRINRPVDITPLAGLKNLTKLSLESDFRFFNVTPLAALQNLSELHLEYAGVTDITPFVGLNKLTNLNLASNAISDVTPLTELKRLKKLKLDANHISDITPLAGLSSLRTVSLSKNYISQVDVLFGLNRLRQVDLSGNQIAVLPSAPARFNTLFYLDVSLNRLESLPSDYFSFFHTTNPNALDLQKKHLVSRQSYDTRIGQAFDFRQSFRGNYYKYIPGLEYYFLESNPLTSPPFEIVQQGREAIENYYKQLQAGEQDYLFEAKLLILGEPGAGKTSMAWKLENTACALPNEEDTTRGLEVKQYYFPIRPEDFPALRHPEKLDDKNFRLNLWDFGGQEIYKATHRFFLSRSALYALVADSRNEDTDFNYWLHIVEMFGGNSPLLIILNEKHGRRRNLDVSAMQNRFGNIVQVIDVDFNETDKTRLGKLRNAVRYHVAQLPHVGSTVPANWTAIREALEHDPCDTVSLQDYLALCHDHGIKETKSALVLSQYFHDIGVFLHFQDDQLLKKTIFLKPNWATGAAYKVLDHELLNGQHGRFSRADADIIWQEDEYTLLRDELLRLMQRFFLTYEVGNSSQYVVPERLPNAQPPYEWEPKDNLYLRYDYEQFMPKGIISQFIVQMHRYITDQDLVWRRGVVLERERTRAEIIETYDARTIRIRVTGRNKRDFLTVIAEQLDVINGQYEKMKVTKLIPCNCDTCKRDTQPHFYPYKNLKTRLERGKREVECGKSYEMVNVQSLIDEVINADLRYLGKQENTPEPSSTMNAKIERDQVFVSYSHKDKDMLQAVQTHLKVLKNEGIPIKLWDDTRIKAGTKWREEIGKALAAAKVAVLLVSTDFLASDFITKTELPALLKAAESEGAVVLPLILKPCRFTKNKELSVFQSINDPAKPLSGLSEHDREEELLKLADRIGELVSQKDS